MAVDVILNSFYLDAVFIVKYLIKACGVFHYKANVKGPFPQVYFSDLEGGI